MQFASINGISMHYREIGVKAGPVVVFSNSLGTDFRIWDDVASRLADTFRIILYDKRGHGLSDCPPAPYRMDDHVGDLEALLAHCGVDSAVIVGLSVGGLIAFGLAARRPDMIRALVIVDSAHRIGDMAMWNERIAQVNRAGIASVSDGILGRWFSPGFRRDRTTEFALYRNMLERTPRDGYAGTCAAIRDSDFTETAKAVSVPTQFIVGSNDGATPPDLVRSAHELVSGSRFAVLEGPGHLPCIEAPHETAAILSDFLKEHRIG